MQGSEITYHFLVDQVVVNGQQFVSYNIATADLSCATILRQLLFHGVSQEANLQGLTVYF